MAEDKLKLPRSSYDELVKIIRAYGRTKEGSNDDIAQLSGIGRTRISANNAFLVGVEIVEGGRKKSPTPKGIELARDLEHESQEEISRAWKKIIEENDFLNKMVQAVSVRKGMEVSQLENHIAYSAGEAKSKEVMTGSRTVIDILRVSELVSENGDRVVPSVSLTKVVADPSTIARPIVTQDTVFQKTQEIAIQPVSSDKISPTGVSLHIEVRINANVDELVDLGEKLNLLIRSLSNANFSNNDEGSTEST